MLLSDFHYDLPQELIALYPPEKRGDSRLLTLDGQTGETRNRLFKSLPDLLRRDDLLVFNNTRVIPARLYGHKETGGRVEVLIERIINPHQAIAQIRASKSPKPGSRIQIGQGNWLEISGREQSLFYINYPSGDLHALLEKFGHIPLPPYIERADQALDKERYQTIFAERPGAVAAPTAGLHFNQAIMAEFENRGVRTAQVTLHVGAGTYQPVRAAHIEEHQMHSEYLEVSDPLCDLIRTTRAKGGRVIAVGTTAVRSLETAAMKAEEAGLELHGYQGDTDIFIYPGYRFRCVDAMITNFHLPESTLLMLVSAFATHKHVFKAYAEAIAQRYRFFSYGDAMFITPATITGRT